MASVEAAAAIAAVDAARTAAGGRRARFAEKGRIVAGSVRHRTVTFVVVGAASVRNRKNWRALRPEI